MNVGGNTKKLTRMHYGSYLPVLVKCLSLTTGDVLELGTGIFSTPILHWICSAQKRNLVSYENDGKYFDLFNIKSYENEFHQIHLIDDWDSIEIEKEWDVVFVDHKPAERRKIDILRVANFADFIVIHDTCWRDDKHYHYKEIFPLFKYRYDYNDYRPHTTVLSNLVDLNGFN